MKYIITEKATGEVIDIVDSAKEAYFEISNFETLDQKLGTFTPDAYAVTEQA